MRLDIDYFARKKKIPITIHTHKILFIFLNALFMKMNSARGASKKKKKKARYRHVNPKCKPNGHLVSLDLGL